VTLYVKAKRAGILTFVSTDNKPLFLSFFNSNNCFGFQSHLQAELRKVYIYCKAVKDEISFALIYKLLISC